MIEAVCKNSSCSQATKADGDGFDNTHFGEWHSDSVSPVNAIDLAIL